MDPKLAAIYGTNQQTDADLEKLAAAELAEGLANDDQLDTEGLSEEDLEAVAQEVLNGDETATEEDVQAAEQEKTSSEEQAQEKLAEADYMGRVMAHSYVKELREIEKTAAGPEAAYGGQGPSFATRVGRSMKGKAEAAGKFAKHHAGNANAAIEGRADKMVAGAKAGLKAGVAKATPHVKKGLEFAGKNKGKGALGALAIGGGLAAHKVMKKESSALNTLVEQRANEILEASGINAEELTQVEGQEKVSDPREALGAAVEERAWALLGQYGVVPAEAEQDGAAESQE